MSELGDESLMTDYFLGDALGSVRQLTDSNGNLTLSKAYDPYGTIAQSAGAGQSSYGYTNEYQRQGALVHEYFFPHSGLIWGEILTDFSHRKS